MPTTSFALGGVGGQTRRLVRWITNSSGTGNEPAPTFQTGCGPGDCFGFAINPCLVRA